MVTAVNERRKAALEAELARVLPLLIGEYGAEKVILFGSLATGEVGEWSDLDLVVIKKTEKKFMDRIDDVTRLTRPRLATDVVVYSPAEFERMCEGRRFFREEIVAKGRVVYDAGMAAVV
ncbi:MAG: nucleotidyltransferase domain-containing protein [candidate division Zixibacteria bacterium]|nr:nucleotidyltransferase domain-containing protein [candidate division Zixibacteria bacterium]